MADEQERLTAALADRYAIQRELGRGGMATVYLAEDLKHKRKVAVKVLRPELSAILGGERFVQEITTTANLQHPHILPLFDSGTADGFLYYVMPYIEGETLRDKLDRETQLGIEEVVRITTEVADALEYAHQQGVIHRDIKPENILLHNGRPMVADFGIALAVSAAAGGRMTETGMSLGTPHYMSPEQATADKDLTNRSDIYSLGSVLYEMLTGEPPHSGGSAQAIIMKIVTDEARPVTELRKSVPQNVTAAVAKSLEKLAADRFDSAKAFADALENPAFATATQVGALSPRLRVPVLTTYVLATITILSTALAMTLLWRGAGGGSGEGSVAPMQFAVDLDPADGFPQVSSVMVTPDERTIVVSALVARRQVLLARWLDRLEATIIPGSEGADRPFLSFDGRWVGFAVGGKLVKLPIEGGTPVELTEARWGGGAWGADGTIVYTPTYQTGLWRVSSAGGDERLLTTPDTAAGELAHWWPQWLPDGRHVVFTAFRTPIDRSTIEVLDLESGERTVLVTGGVMGRYVASGHLLYARNGSILAVPFDLRAREVTGAAAVVVQDVAMEYVDGFAAYDVSPGGMLVVMPSDVAGSRYQVVEVDRRGVERVLLAQPDRYENPRFAPDGRRLSLDIRPPRAATDVWVVDPVRGSRTRVTAHEGSDFGSDWTPDGRDLVYMSERPLFELYRRAADGSRAQERLVGGDYDRIMGSISDDGRLAVFVASVASGETGNEIWTVDLSGPAEERKYLTSAFRVAHPALSPDGNWMAYDSEESGRLEVYVQSYPDPTVARRQVSSGGGSQPRWTREGRELVFQLGDSLMTASINSGSGAVGTPELLFAGAYASSAGSTDPPDYDVTPDGERFLLLKWPAASRRPRVVVSTRWFDELRALVDGAGQSR